MPATSPDLRREGKAGPARLALLLPDMRGGGAERVALTLILHFVNKDHEVDLVLLDAQGELLELLPPEVRVFDLHSPRARNAVAPLRRYLRYRRPAAIQVSMWPLTIVGVLAHRLAGSTARLVLSDHTILSRHFGHLGPLGKRTLRTSIRLLYPLADARIAVSRQSADDLARLSGIDRASIEMVYNPVPVPPDAPIPPAVERLWQGAAQRILTVGSLKREKNQALLIGSFARAFRGADAKLMILGEGPLRAELEALAAAEGVAQQVSMPGFAADPWPYYASAGLFALSSDYEGYPLVLIEAMRSGLNIVSTDCESGPDEILEGGRYGLLVPVGDEAALAAALRQGLDRPADADIRARAESLSGQGIADRYLALMLGTSPVRG